MGSLPSFRTDESAVRDIEGSETIAALPTERTAPFFFQEYSLLFRKVYVVSLCAR
jgi:hypothetical protein